MKKLLYIMLALVLTLSAAMMLGSVSKAAVSGDQIVVAQDDWGDEGEEEDAFGNIMHTSYIKISSVDFAAPAANAPCKVSVKAEIVGAEDEEEEPKVVSGKIVYAINGDLKGKKEAALTCADNACTGEIPGQAAGAKVAFAVALTDTFGNTTMQGLPVASAADAKDALIAGKADMDNSVDIVPDDMDLLGLSAAYDKDTVYVSFDVQGKFSGGTLDPPYIQLYGIKMSNPDIEQNEGLMVGKLWIVVPLAKDKEVQEKFLKPLLLQAKEYIDKIGEGNIQKVLDSGMLVLDIGKLMSGNYMEGLLFSAEPTGEVVNGNTFVGSIKRAALGDNPSGFARIITLTAANASIDSFMPIPLNCSHYIQIVFSNQEYAVK